MGRVEGKVALVTGAAQGMGRAARRSVINDVYAVLNTASGAGPTLSDAIALFNGSHNNLLTAGAITAANLVAAKNAMRVQRDTDSNEYLDIAPRYLLCTITDEADAITALSDQFDPDKANRTGVRNPARGIVPPENVIASPRVNSRNWYLFADPNLAPVLEVVYLDGVQEPYVEQTIKTNPAGLQILVRLDYGVAAIGWRGAQRNPYTG